VCTLYGRERVRLRTENETPRLEWIATKPTLSQTMSRNERTVSLDGKNETDCEVDPQPKIDGCDCLKPKFSYREKSCVIMSSLLTTLVPLALERSRLVAQVQ
jgi:hypothetical protein